MQRKNWIKKSIRHDHEQNEFIDLSKVARVYTHIYTSESNEEESFLIAFINSKGNAFNWHYEVKEDFKKDLLMIQEVIGLKV